MTDISYLGKFMRKQQWNNKERYLFLWVFVCFAITLVGILLPVNQLQSIGLEGANQANLKSKTEELTQGRLLEFLIDLPSDTIEQLGFYVSSNEHEFTGETLRIYAFDEHDVLISGKEFALSDLETDQFLFIDFDIVFKTALSMKIQISSDAKENGPSVWLNETTKTAGNAFLDGATLEKSLVYNLIYSVQVHQIQKPVMLGLICVLFGFGIYAVGGFEKRGREKLVKKNTKWQKPKKKQWLLLLIMLLLGALLFYYLYDTKIRIAQNTTEKAAVLKSNGEILSITEETSSLVQVVEPKEDSLTGLGVRFYLPEQVSLSEGSMHARVTDLTLGELLCETDISASQFISGEYIGLLFHNSQTGVSSHSYKIELIFSEELWNSGLAVMSSDEGICVNAYLYFNIFLKKFFFAMFLAVEAFLLVFWWLNCVQKVRLETVFFVSILFFGLIYNVMLTPQMVPDEAKHIDMAYRYSNEWLGYDSLGDTKCWMRADDAQIKFTSSPSFQNYRNIYYGLFSKVSDASMVEAEINSNIEGSILLYLPAVIGMTFARRLGLGTVPMLLLARYLNLVVFAIFAWAGMKRLPFGKMTLFILALLPINMQQCTSFSHDAMVHGIIFYYSCLCLEAIFSEKKLNGQQMLLMEIAALCLVFCKSGSYLPLAFVPLLFPVARYAGKREKYLGTAALFGIPVLAFLMKHMKTVGGIVQTTAATSVVNTGDGTQYLSGYTLGYFLNDPLEFVYMMANTVFDKIGFYIESLIGYQLGWVEIETSMLVVLLFCFLLFLSICESGQVICIQAFQRFWLILLCLGSTGLILLGMLLQWTPMGHVSIEGVQGRYFLPFLLLLLTAFKNSLIYLKRNIDRELAGAVVAGQLLTLMYVIKQVLMV